MRSFVSIATSASLFLGLAIDPSIASAQTPPTPTTPIQHVIVIYGENISFDHYFGMYPQALNTPGQPRFTALPGTPSVNGYLTNPTLLTNNPNLNPANGTGAANPFRLNRNQALTADQSHSYAPEQASFDQFAMDLFPSKTGAAGGTPNLYPPVVNTKGMVMGYFDGNTVTAMWNYAQNFALSDNSYNSSFGPSSPGAINLVAGQTNGIIATKNAPSSDEIADGQGGFTLFGDADPYDDICSGSSTFQARLSGKNVGDLLNAAGVSWGWFQGGFDLTLTNPNGTTGCARSTVSPITGLTEADYVQHHNPFQFYASTINPTHTRPTSLATIGQAGDGGNHIYDIHDFFDALGAGNLPSVSYLKAQAYQNAHPGNSNPLDEQAFVVSVVNAVESSPFWNSTAIILAYDDSDGWYDHQPAPVGNASFTTSDSVSGTNACGVLGTTPQLPGPNSAGLPVNGRCGPGVRTPLLVISPWAKPNFVDHTLTIQTSILLFIEQNWSLGQIGGGSFDTVANPINNMFNFSKSVPQNTNLPLLNPTTGLPE
jgi:phospholipase C